MKKNINFFTSKQASTYLQIPLRTIQHLTKQGKIKAIRIGNNWKYAEEDILGYLSHGTDFSREPVRKPDNFIEHRSCPRINTNFKCQYSIQLHPFKDINSEGIIKDLSATGILLINKRDAVSEIGINDPIDLEFCLVSNDNENINVKLKGKVMRNIRDEIGIKFRNIDGEMQKRITEYVD